jgi:hypothetical protein
MDLLTKATVHKFDGFEVHTFQINVPLGDCAIHLLVKHAPRYDKAPGFDSTTPLPDQAVKGASTVGVFQLPQHRAVIGVGKRGTVFRALLFDGGHDNTGANYDGRASSFRIEKVIRDIEANYIIDNHDATKGGDAAAVAGTPIRDRLVPIPKDKKTQLVFDSWVVTHWDRDHYCGSLTMIRNDVFDRWDNGTVAEPRSSYMKYDANGKCLSVMYCPAWERVSKGASKKKGTAKPKGAPSIFVKDLDSETCAKIYLSPKPAIPLNFTSPRGKVPTSAPLFKVAVGEQNLMGVDFFSHGQFKPANAMSETWWDEPDSDRLHKVLDQPRDYSMIPAPTAAQPSWPFFVCIAVCGYVYGHKDTVDKPPTTLRPSLDRPDADAPTVDNYVSIVAVLVWKTGQDLRLSHFCGGDAHMNTEMSILSFLKDAAGQPLQIEVLKAGHHGSRSSTPVDLLLDCRPKKFIISAGKAHGHPSGFPRFTVSPSSTLPISICRSDSDATQAGRPLPSW